MGDGKKLTEAEKKALKEKVRKLLGADTKKFGGGGYMKKKSYKGGGELTFEEKANMGNDAAKALATGKTKDGFPLTKAKRKELEKIKKTNQNIYLMSPAPFEDDGMFEASKGAMIPKYKKGGKLGKKKGLDFNGDGKITKADFIMMAKANAKKKKKK